MIFMQKPKDNHLEETSCDTPILEKIQITEENFEGYTALFSLQYSDEEDFKIQKKCLINTFLGTVILLPSFLFPDYIPMFVLTYFGFGIFQTTSFVHKTAKNSNKRKQELIEKYPYVNLKTNSNELRKALEECGILTTKLVNGYSTLDLNTTNFKNQILLFQLLQMNRKNLSESTKKSIDEKAKDIYEKLPKQAKIYFWTNNYNNLINNGECPAVKLLTDTLPKPDLECSKIEASEEQKITIETKTESTIKYFNESEEDNKELEEKGYTLQKPKNKY